MKEFPFEILGQDDDATESRQTKQLKNIIRHLSRSDDSPTMPQIAEHARISIPTGTKLVRQLVDHGLVVEEGKKATENGRKPAVYTLNKDRFYTVGVEILSKWIHASVDRVDLETVHEDFSRDFVLEDTGKCLDFIVAFIKKTIAESPVAPEQLIGVGIAMTGSVNGRTGDSADYFNRMEMPLKQYLEEQLQLPVLIDNDTRVIAIAEQVLGRAKGVDNVLLVKFSRDLGLSIIHGKQMIFGADGFAGNFGHLQFGDLQRLCSCGKKNCLRTEVSGDALYRDMQEALAAGETSMFFNKDTAEHYRYHDILDAVLKGDSLSIELLSRQGEKLGPALGNLVNLLNPNMIVIGGEFVMVQDFLLDAIRTGMNKTGLVKATCELPGCCQ